MYCNRYTYSVPFIRRWLIRDIPPTVLIICVDHLVCDPLATKSDMKNTYSVVFALTPFFFSGGKINSENEHEKHAGLVGHPYLSFKFKHQLRGGCISSVYSLSGSLGIILSYSRELCFWFVVKNNHTLVSFIIWNSGLPHRCHLPTAMPQHTPPQRPALETWSVIPLNNIPVIIQ